MKSPAVDNPLSAFASGKPRRLKWTCRFCETHFQTWTRRGVWVTCPNCNRGQEGPAGIQRLLDKAQTPAQKAAITKATTIQIVSVAKVPAAKPPPKPVHSPPAAKVQPKPPVPSPAAAPSRSLGDLIGKAMGFS